MTYDEAYDTIHRDLLPVFLGSNRTSHKLATVLFRRYGTVSVIADRRRTLLDLINPTTQFLPLPPSGDERLTAELLLELAAKDRDSFPLLVSCTEAYKSLTEKEADLLESHFILTESENLLDRSPLADFPSEGGPAR